MNCPKCHHEHVGVYRTTDEGWSIRRIRECPGCGHRFVTVEEMASDADNENTTRAAGRQRVAELNP